MGLFSRATDADRRLDHQSMALELIDAFAAHDTVGLAALGQADRAQQVRVRRALYDYVDRIWEDAKARGLDPAIRPEWSVVAGLRDLTDALLAWAMQSYDESEMQDHDESERLLGGGGSDGRSGDRVEW